MTLEAGLAIAVAAFAWWFSTGLLLLLNRLPRRTFPYSLAATTVVAAAGVAAIYVSRDWTTTAGAYLGFFGALGVWAWHELSFLTGLIAGPRRSDCPAGLAGWNRFKAATETLITHEVAILVTAVAFIALLWDSANPTALVTFMALWILRLSAKLNIFLGIPNLSEEFLPAHLDYLKTYFRNAPMNALFPFSVTLGTLGAAAVAMPAFGPGATDFVTVSAVLAATLIALGVLEHWLMVLPVADAALWRWALRNGAREEPAGGACGDAVATGKRAPLTQLHRLNRKPEEIGKRAAFASALVGGRT